MGEKSDEKFFFGYVSTWTQKMKHMAAEMKNKVRRDA